VFTGQLTKGAAQLERLRVALQAVGAAQQEFAQTMADMAAACDASNNLAEYQRIADGSALFLSRLSLSSSPFFSSLAHTKFFSLTHKRAN
jgi:hypothetical protein